MSESLVVNFYAGKCILITGATGFIGKVLLEKLLSSCPNIDKIYLLIRPNHRYSTPELRVEKLLKSQVFTSKILPIEKVVAICGDIGVPNLGLSERDRKIVIENVSVVFHIAANVKFHGPIREFMEQNVLGTESVMQLANEMKKLESLVYVSTAYSNCNLHEIEEKVYPLSKEPEFLIEQILTENRRDNKIPCKNDPVLMGRPNSYTISKAIAENVIQKPMYAHLPVAICRPSIVAHAIRDPVEGWCDSLNGCAGLVLFAQLVNLDCIFDIIPVDFVANSLIVIGWHTAQMNPQDSNPKVINLITGADNPLTWGEFGVHLLKSISRWPSTKMVRPFPGPDLAVLPGFYGNIKHFFLKLFLHYIFAFLLDFVQLIKGKPRMMFTVVEKMERACEAMTFFTTNQWNFHSQNYRQIHSSLSEREQDLFLSDVKQINWLDYCHTMMIGNRRYLLKEDDSNMKMAKRKFKKVVFMYRVISLTMKMILFAIGFYCIRLLFQTYF